MRAVQDNKVKGVARSDRIHWDLPARRSKFHHKLAIHSASSIDALVAHDQKLNVCHGHCHEG